MLWGVYSGWPVRIETSLLAAEAGQAEKPTKLAISTRRTRPFIAGKAYMPRQGLLQAHARDD